MSRNTHSTAELENNRSNKWLRRDKKKNKKMKIHGQGLKKLSQILNNKKPKTN